jgi:hypothetical protein
MREARLIRGVSASEVHPVQLDDFSRFKEKLIMINALKNLVEQTDKGTLKGIAEAIGGKMTAKNLQKALESLVDHATKRVAS